MQKSYVTVTKKNGINTTTAEKNSGHETTKCKTDRAETSRFPTSNVGCLSRASEVFEPA
ncbi:AAEL003620-PA [Aedes aegypti]|uniref:AAEL003620-PA n=1 Tax=Aedes aegypti TaxID=7159 RepID=Q17EY6_AEDAE|nr:AAEL003620-PA [Aedes aegypti]